MHIVKKLQVAKSPLLQSFSHSNKTKKKSNFNLKTQHFFNKCYINASLHKASSGQCWDFLHWSTTYSLNLITCLAADVMGFRKVLNIYWPIRKESIDWFKSVGWTLTTSSLCPLHIGELYEFETWNKPMGMTSHRIRRHKVISKVWEHSKQTKRRNAIHSREQFYSNNIDNATTSLSKWESYQASNRVSRNRSWSGSDSLHTGTNNWQPADCSLHSRGARGQQELHPEKKNPHENFTPKFQRLIPNIGGMAPLAKWEIFSNTHPHSRTPTVRLSFSFITAVLLLD